LPKRPIVVVHDFAGHPFQAELSRRLAGEGYEVWHLYSADTITGKGSVESLASDPHWLRFVAVKPSARYSRYAPIARSRFEFSYGRAVSKAVRRINPDLFITCNTPLFVLRVLVRSLAKTKTKWVFWHQDIVSLAVGDEAARVLPASLARVLRRLFVSIEASAVRSADHVVAIGQFFADQYTEWGVTPKQLSIIPNWAPLEDIVPKHRDNGWAASNLTGLPSFRVLYAGTLGRKHNPELLIHLIEGLEAAGAGPALVVVSEGDGADLLRDRQAFDPRIRVLPYQDFEQLSSVLSSGDVLVGLLEPDASKFSVPSKVLSYLAAGRPTVLFAPSTNPAAHTVKDLDRRSGVGRLSCRHGWSPRTTVC
jgi:colanic acid biosynthesis glycosyl transferase WcaI